MPNLRIAIVGGGLASICLAKGLSKNTKLSITIFEASDGTWEGGQAFGLAINAQKALGMIDADLRRALDDAGGTRMVPSLRLRMGTGERSGEWIADVGDELEVMVVGRGAFQRGLNNTVAGTGIKIVNGKKVESVELSDGEAILHFQDSSTQTFDGVIGCDGLNSTVRSAIPGALPAVSTGGWNHRIVVPLSQAQGAFGDEYCLERTQTGWIGDGGFCLADFCNDGASMQVIAGWMGDREKEGRRWPYEKPFAEWPKQRLIEDMKYWGNMGKSMIKVRLSALQVIDPANMPSKLFTAQPKLYAATGRSHPETPTFTNKNICIMGDAAQSFPPFKGAGAGLAIEDALLLSSVMAKVSTTDEIEKAFSVYDRIRRPRRWAIARASAEAGLLLCGKSAAGVDVERLREESKSWGEDIVAYDLESMVREGERMKEEGTPNVI